MKKDDDNEAAVEKPKHLSYFTMICFNVGSELLKIN